MTILAGIAANNDLVMTKLADIGSNYNENYDTVMIILADIFRQRACLHTWLCLCVRLWSANF